MIQFMGGFWVQYKLTYMALCFKTDGGIDPWFGGFADLQKAVGGYVEVFNYHTDDTTLVFAVNEDGLYNSLPPNNQINTLGFKIFGNVVVFTQKEWDLVGNGGVL